MPSEANFLTAGEREAGAGCPHCPAEITVGVDVAVCRGCGKVHHRACWDGRGGCGSYACAPANRGGAGASADAALLRISADDLGKASPLPARSAGNGYPVGFGGGAGPTGFVGSAAAPPPMSKEWSRWAIAAFVAGVGSVLLLGATGLPALLLAAIALASLRDHRGYQRRGAGLAAAGLLLGVLGMTGWAVAGVWYFGDTLFGGGGVAHLNFADDLGSVDLEAYEPRIRRAVQANVLVQQGSGWSLSTGSGVILQIAEGEALIVTNRHVVDPDYAGNPDAPASPENLNNGNVEVRMLGQPGQSAKVVWVAPDGIDLALLRTACTADTAKRADWRKGRKPRIGGEVIAVGNPLQLGWTVTRGSLSQIRNHPFGKRTVQVLQTTAAINFGNSGGGLYDAEGFLIGINTWTKDKRAAEGLGFAISVESLLDLKPEGLDLSTGAALPEKP